MGRYAPTSISRAPTINFGLLANYKPIYINFTIIRYAHSEFLKPVERRKPNPAKAKNSATFWSESTYQEFRFWLLTNLGAIRGTSIISRKHYDIWVTIPYRMLTPGLQLTEDNYPSLVRLAMGLKPNEPQDVNSVNLKTLYVHVCPRVSRSCYLDLFY